MDASIEAWRGTRSNDDASEWANFADVLSEAVGKNAISVVRVLLRRGATPSSLPAAHVARLAHAFANSDDLESLGLLMKQGEVRLWYGQPLTFSLLRKLLPLLDNVRLKTEWEALEKVGADTSECASVLVTAAQNNKVNVLQIMFEAGFPPLSASKECFYAAAMAGHGQVVRMLHERACSVQME